MRTLFRRSAVVTALAAALVAGCMTRGSGTEQRESRQSDAFTEIEAGGVFDVRVTVGPEASIEIIGDDNIVPLVHTEVTGDRLHIGSEGNISPKLDLVVNITTPSLQRLRSSGAGSVRVEGLRGDTFELDASGASKVHLAGEVETLELEQSGAGNVDAASLQARTVRADLSGAGSADVLASETLVAHVSGAGSIRYAGDPSDVEQHVSGAGSVRPR
jgi:hypothetical protein